MTNDQRLKTSFLFNNVEVRFVGKDPDTGIALYVNNGHGGVIGVRVYPNGRKDQCNATLCTNQNSKYNGRRKQHYLQLKDAFGHHRHILASRAVYIAWIGPIKPGMTIDHINGITTDNRFENLRQISNAINNRDGGFLRKLRHKGINTAQIDKARILRYFARMAKLKPAITKHRYERLTKPQLVHLVYDETFDVECFIVYHLKINPKNSMSIFSKMTSKK